MKTLKWMVVITGLVVGGSWILSKLSTPKQEVLYGGDIVQDIPQAETTPDALEAELKRIQDIIFRQASTQERI